MQLCFSWLPIFLIDSGHRFSHYSYSDGSGWPYKPQSNLLYAWGSYLDVVGCISWLPSLVLLVWSFVGTSRVQLTLLTFSTTIDLGAKIVLRTLTVPPKPHRFTSPSRYCTSTRTQRRRTYLYLAKYRWMQLS